MTPEQWAAKTIHHGRPCKGPEGMGRELGLCAFCAALSEDFSAALRQGAVAALREASLRFARAGQADVAEELADFANDAEAP